MVVAAAFAADRSVNVRYRPLMSVLHCAHNRCLPYNSTLHTQHGGIDRQFVRMVTDVYGAGGVITTAVRAVHTTVGVAADAATRRIRGL